jgi:RimJ/RimL family protein N-acetyltransferase
VVAVIWRAPTEPLSDGTVVVRLPHDRDVEALVRYGDDPDVAETIWVPVPTPCPRDVAAARLAEFRDGWEQEKRFGPALIIAASETDEMIGVILLRLREHDSIELTYGVAPAYRNRGIATAAAVLVSGWCLEELAAARVELRVGKSNLASQRVAAKAGFSCEAIVGSYVAATGTDYEDLLFVRR